MWAVSLTAGVLAMLGSAAPARAGCADLPSWIATGCNRLVDTWENGDNAVLLSGYAWHLPYTWTEERRKELNANAWGGGFARVTEEADGDTHSVYALVFEDSHKHAQFNVGYEYSTYWGPRSGVQPGLGFSVFVLQRSDIANGFPVPGILPVASLRYRNATLFATYIPTLNGGVNHGSTLYVFGRIVLK
ncbi:MAG: lipid IV(A) palmitoyltransferase PagP [Casimicrobiaceae bacterium]